MYYLTQKQLFIKMWCKHLDEEETKRAVAMWEQTVQAKMAELVDAWQNMWYTMRKEYGTIY